MKKLSLLFMTMLISGNAAILSMKRLPEDSIEQGNEKKVKIEHALEYPLSNGQVIKLNREAVLLCDQLIDLLTYSQEDYDALFAETAVNTIPYDLHLTDDETTLLFTILNAVTQSGRFFVDPKTQKRHYLNHDMFERVYNICKEQKALNTNTLIQMMGACDYLICPTLLNIFVRIFVDKSKELTINHDYNLEEFSHNIIRLLSKHFKRKTLGIKLNRYIPECTVTDYIILIGGALPLVNNQIILTGLPNQTKLTTLDGLEMLVPHMNASSITAINLSNNCLALTHDFTSLKNFPNTAILNLNNNHFIQLPENIFDALDQLQILDLSHNKLIQLSEHIFNNFLQLQRLELGHNQLTELPHNIFNNLNGLRRLDLNHNKLTNLPANIFNNLNELQILSLNNNALTQLSPTMFNNLNQLQILDLQFNQLTVLPTDIFNNLGWLQALNLSYNKLTQLSATIFNNLVQLTELFITHNLLNQLPETIFNNLHQLRILRLEYNKLDSLPENIFGNLAQLQELSLSDNPLSFLPEKITLLLYWLNREED